MNDKAAREAGSTTDAATTDAPTAEDMATEGMTADVLVVGAGPTGLLLAGDLAAAGISVTLIERRPHGTSNMTRAFGVHARTLEQLDARDLADELITTGTPITRLRLFRRLSLDLSLLRSRFPFLLITPQYEVERLLERRARATGVTFRYGTELLGLEQSAETVTAEVRGGDGARTTVRARYLVGTDGVRSAVRSALDMPFPGDSVIRSIVLADVRLTEEPEGLLTVNGAGRLSPSSPPSGTAGTASWGGTGPVRCRTASPSTSTRCARSPASPSARTTACTTPAGSPASTATNARSPPTAWAGSSSRATRHTCTPPQAARG